MSTPFKPITRADLLWKEGRPFSKAFQSLYFSSDNGLEESEHVFIQGNQLIQRWQALPDKPAPQFTIGEIGFGSGLNFLLTWSLWERYAPSCACLHYISCELFPFSKEDISKAMAFWPSLQNQAEAFLEAYPVLTPGFHRIELAKGRVVLLLMLGDALACYKELLHCGDAVLEQSIRSWWIDAWYLDGFAPAKNPALWSRELVYTLGLLSKPGTTLATHSAAPNVKEILHEVGFQLQEKPGYGRKNPMLCAQFTASPILRLGRKTPWHVATPQHDLRKQAIVIGAGLSGCMVAHALARRGWQVTVLEQAATAAQGASGNRQAILYPPLSAFQSPLTVFMLQAFLFAVPFYRQLLSQGCVGECQGLLQLACDEQERRRHLQLTQWLAEYPELGRLVDTPTASNVAGIPLEVGGLFIPNAGWIDATGACELLTHHAGVTLQWGVEVEGLHCAEGAWWVGEFHAPVVVLANGFQANQFAQTRTLPIKAMQGQVTYFSSTQETQKLKTPLCGNGHVVPAYQSMHSVGATYHRATSAWGTTAEDDTENLRKLYSMSSTMPWPARATASWSGIRSVTPDYLPLLGPVADAHAFQKVFAGLQKDANRWIPAPGAYHPGLYLSAGYGSRGLTAIPLSAEYLAGLINQEPSILPRNVVQALSPARFLRKGILQIKK